MRIAFVSLATAVAALNMPATAQGTKLNARSAEKAVSVRQSLYDVIGWNIGGLSAIARGRVPYDAEKVSTNSERLAQLGAMIPDAFAADTRAFDLETDARAKIWDEFDQFMALAADMTAAAQQVQAYAEAGDESAAKAAIQDLAATCKSCHQAYRKD